MKHSNTGPDREYGSHMMSIPGIHLKKYNKHWNKQVSRICLQALLQKIRNQETSKSKINQNVTSLKSTYFWILFQNVFFFLIHSTPFGRFTLQSKRVFFSEAIVEMVRRGTVCCDALNFGFFFFSRQVYIMVWSIFSRFLSILCWWH